MRKKNSLSKYQVAQLLGISKAKVQESIDRGFLTMLPNGMISKEEVLSVISQKKALRSLREIMERHDNDRFDSKLSKHREKYIDFLEMNGYFGAKLIDPKSIFWSNLKKDDWFLDEKDANLIEENSCLFFEDYGLSDQEIIDKLLDQNKDNNTVKLLSEYLEVGEVKITPSVISFVRMILESASIYKLTNQDVVGLIESAEGEKTKQLIISFLQYVGGKINVNYSSQIQRKPQQRELEKAYDYITYVTIARVLFNEDSILSNNMIEKALDDHMVAEAWLFLAAHYICGWRASDICNAWIYPNLSYTNNPFRLDLDNLKRDIIVGNISNSTYSMVTDYIVDKIILSRRRPAKTRVQDEKLKITITPELKPFFGRLVLIAEYHHMVCNDGYMISNRIPTYRNWIFLRESFGDGIYNALGRKNISSRRLNKSFEQVLEETAIAGGNTAIVAYMIASLARNHANIATTAIYLRDHNLSGLDAHTVLYLMMQRGVLSFYAYNMLLLAFPDAFYQLSEFQKTELLSLLSIDTLTLELLTTEQQHIDVLKDAIWSKNNNKAINILQGLFEIANGRGVSKQKGVGCIQTALGYACPYSHQSCIENQCKYHILLRDGIPTLVSAINYYIQKYQETANEKYKTVLIEEIIPNNKSIIDELIKNMNPQEGKTFLKLVEEAIHE